MGNHPHFPSVRKVPICQDVLAIYSTLLALASGAWGGNWIKTLLMQGNVDITDCLNCNGAAPRKLMSLNVNHDQLLKVNNVKLKRYTCKRVISSHRWVIFKLKASTFESDNFSKIFNR
jgi:hypothetical protein